jgi:uncharacterized Ntn-hydrolase superfamily protein
MTYSLTAVCPRTGQVGVAAMTAMVGVGKLVSHAMAGVGAAASQAFMNPYLAIDGLWLLDDGVPAAQALDRLIAEDPGRAGRQFGIVDVSGGSAAWTGDQPEDWKGHHTGEGWACQGNRLAGPEVLDSAIEAFLDERDRPLVERLIHALDAGEDAAGRRPSPPGAVSTRASSPRGATRQNSRLRRPSRPAGPARSDPVSSAWRVTSSRSAAELGAVGRRASTSWVLTRARISLVGRARSTRRRSCRRRG